MKVSFLIFQPDYLFGLATTIMGYIISKSFMILLNEDFAIAELASRKEESSELESFFRQLLAASCQDTNIIYCGQYR